MKLERYDYVCIHRRRYSGNFSLEFGVYIAPDAIPMIAFTRDQFENYWPMRFPRSPLYLIKIVDHEPVIIRRIGYKGCP